MRLAQLGPAGQERPVASQDGSAWWDLSPLTHAVDGGFLASGLPRAAAALRNGDLAPVQVAGQRWGAPVARPGKIVCVGLNYIDHAIESGMEPPEEPVLFLKAPYCVQGPSDDVLIPRGSEKTDYEVELGVVIGKPARYLGSDAEALECIAGYVISHDVSERAFQLERGGQWDKGKSCETFNPLGPWLVTSDEVPDPQGLSLRLSVNGEPRQEGTTAQMIFSVAALVRYISQFMLLEPGDLVNTGTPAGVALARPESGYLRPGDRVELEISSLGRQRHVFKETA
jgi:2-keto-4-pentenoate hydratase/2-oxohepta-3-ene-1,7-dioic acid hydratase in catechol pathway